MSPPLPPNRSPDLCHVSLPLTEPLPPAPPPLLPLCFPPQPDSGRLEAYRVPGGPGIRLDGAVTAGNVISRYYDSLLAKVIASAPTYDKAIQRMARALQEFQVGGGGGGGSAPQLPVLQFFCRVTYVSFSVALVCSARVCLAR